MTVVVVISSLRLPEIPRWPPTTETHTALLASHTCADLAQSLALSLNMCGGVYVMTSSNSVRFLCVAAMLFAQNSMCAHSCGHAVKINKYVDFNQISGCMPFFFSVLISCIAFVSLGFVHRFE